jgi:hypothetical protein
MLCKFKMNKPGLSILEVMIAVLMVGVSVTALLSLQGVLSRSVYSAHGLIIRLPFIRSYFVEADRDGLYEKAEPQKKTIEDPLTQLTYSVEKKAFKQFEHTVIERVDAQWTLAFGPRKEMATRIKFAPAKERKKGKS